MNGGWQRALVLVCALLFATRPAFAHRPWERNLGSFKRQDGTVISIVDYRVDGIIGADPGSVQFRLPDGSILTNTSFVFDSAVWRVPSGIEVYQYSNTFIPVADRVLLFDGTGLKDITPERQRFSPFIHLATRWSDYLFFVGFGLVMVCLWRALSYIPKFFGSTVLKIVGRVILALLSLQMLIGIIFVATISFLVLVGFLAICFGAYLLISKRRLSGVAAG